MRRRTLLLGLASLATTGLITAGNAKDRVTGDFHDTRPPEERGVRGDFRDTRPPEERGVRRDIPPRQDGDKGRGLAPPDRTTGSSSGNSSVGGLDRSFGGSSR